MTVQDDIDALLQDAAEQIAAASQLHQQALDKQSRRRPFKTRVKNVLENQRSVLDYMAQDLTDRFGTQDGGVVYYPLASEAAAFDGEMNAKMPGVAAQRPAIADAIERHQTYKSVWLKTLSSLVREQKHRQLSPQLVRKIFECMVTEVATGAVAGWRGIRFHPGRIQAPTGGATFIVPGEEGRPDGAAKPLDVQAGLAILVFGVPIDYATQQPIPDERIAVEAGPIEEWCFVEPHMPVMSTLRAIQGSVTAAIADIRRAADL
jgi:hypothetical protein